MESIFTFRNITICILVIVSTFACNDKETLSTGERYFGRIENINGEQLTNASLSINRLDNFVTTNDSLITLIETNSDGFYDITLEETEKTEYKMTCLEEDTHLFIVDSEQPLSVSPLKHIIWRTIKPENELNLMFCKRNTINININKTANDDNSLELLLLPYQEEGTYEIPSGGFERMTLENRDTTFQREICKIDSIYIGGRTFNDEGTIANHSWSFPVSQFNPNDITIEY